MGRQLPFHALPEDCIELLSFIQGHDRVLLTTRDSDAAEIEAAMNPCNSGVALCLWNQGLLPELHRDFIADAYEKPYYRVPDTLPVLEFSPPKLTEWNGIPALIQGRIWGAFETSSKGYDSWYQSIVRWIRKTYLKSRDTSSYVGPMAQKWQSRGGILLPMFNPPDTPQWRLYFEKQLSSAASVAE